MTDHTPLEKVIELTDTLSPIERVQLVEHVMATLKHELTHANPAAERALLGLWRGTPSITEDDIDDARREMWSNFPREDL